MGFRDIAVRYYDAWVREPRLIWNHYRPFSGKNKEEDYMVFMANGWFPHGGMFDRLKGIVSTYAASKVLGKTFKICFTSPFGLEKYLEPNVYDWRLANEDVTLHYPAARPLFIYGEQSNPGRLLKKRSGEVHVFYGTDALTYINSKYNRQFSFGELYHELFKPTPYLQQHIDLYQKEIGKEYVVVHFRFLNLIGDKTEFASVNPSLPKAEQDDLIEKSITKLKEIEARHGGVRLMLATDSPKFSQLVSHEMPQVYIAPGEIKHIGTAGETSDGANLKMFVDYYLIAGACKVYNLVGPGMWKSAFPEYAAKIGQKPFERSIFV